MPDGIEDFEDVRTFTLEASAEAELLARQTECTFIWANSGGFPVGVTMNFLHQGGRFWLTASRQRARIRAVARDARVSIVVSSKGAGLGPQGRSVTYKCRAHLHDPPEADLAGWFYDALSQALRPDEATAASFRNYLDSPNRVILELVPEQRIGFDSTKQWKAAPTAAPTGWGELLD